MTKTAAIYAVGIASHKYKWRHYATQPNPTPHQKTDGFNLSNWGSSSPLSGHTPRRLPMSNILLAYDFSDLPNRDFNFGRLLVVKASSNLSIKDVKRLTAAKSVNELTDPHELLHPVSMLFQAMSDALDCVYMLPTEYAIKIYQVDEHAASSLYALADSDYLCSVTFKGDEFKQFNSLVMDARSMDLMWGELRGISNYYNGIEEFKIDEETPPIEEIDPDLEEGQMMAKIAWTTFALSKKARWHAANRLYQQLEAKW